MTSVDAELEATDVDALVVKLDVEGAEPRALAGMTETIARRFRRALPRGEPVGARGVGSDEASLSRRWTRSGSKRRRSATSASARVPRTCSACDARPMSVHELRVCVTAPDYDEALRFYRDVLGLKEVAAFRRRTGTTILEAGRATLELLDPTHAAFVDEVEVGRRISTSASPSRSTTRPR